jgi:predicted nucleic acid-binding protein
MRRYARRSNKETVDLALRRLVAARLSVEEAIAWTEPILSELSAGARSPRRAADLRALLVRGPILAVEGRQDGETAAQLYRSARSRGLTVRSSMDGLITAVAIHTDTPVLARDRDADALAQVCDLVIEHPSP